MKLKKTVKVIFTLLALEILGLIMLSFYFIIFADTINLRGVPWFFTVIFSPIIGFWAIENTGFWMFFLLPPIMYLLASKIKLTKQRPELTTGVVLLIITPLILYRFFSCDLHYFPGYYKAQYQACFGHETGYLDGGDYESDYLKNVDFDSFNNLSPNRGEFDLTKYAKQDDAVFYAHIKDCYDACVRQYFDLETPIPNADPTTFQAIAQGYALDKNYLYYKGEVLEQSKPNIIYLENESPSFLSQLQENQIIYQTETKTGVINVIKMEPSEFSATIRNNTEAKKISQWSQQFPDSVIINGEYFHLDNTPAGYLSIDGTSIGTDIFDQDKSGLFSVLDGQPEIRDLAVQPIREDESFDFALQSYPFIIKNQQPAIKEDSGKEARRSAIGIDQDGSIYLILSNQPNLTLYEFMNILVDSGISFQNVLNLDGGPSSGLAINLRGAELLIDSETTVPNVLKFSLNRQQ